MKRRLALACTLAVFAIGPSARAQLAIDESSAAPRPARITRYLEGARERIVETDAAGAMWLRTATGGRVSTALGTDRVIVVGDARALAGLDVVVDEVLSPRAAIVAVRSTRPHEDALGLASRLRDAVRAGVIESAAPDLAFAHVARDIAVPPNDPRYGGQWFYETIDIEEAWAREDGDPGVTIAVVDNGCDRMHPDLAGHLLDGYDAVDDDDDPSFLPGAEGNEHGTACAGLAAAVTDNALDVAGACPECSLRCIRLLGAPGALIPISSDVRAFEFARTHEDVAVVSNSWGFAAGVPAPAALVREIETVIAEGRGGRGALVVFAAGNDASVIDADELQAIEGVLTVGAINTFDEAASFSNSGECVALVAPTGTLTTDISGPEGSAPGDTTTTFGGTSSACPIVAGVGGLLASAAPTLTGLELREVLVATVRPAPFATPDDEGHDLLYGYGILDPAAAILRVRPDAEDAGPAGGDVGLLVADAGATPASSGCACRATRARPPTALGAWLSAAWVLVGLGRRRVRTRRRGARARARWLSLAGATLFLAGCAEEAREARPTVSELRPDSPGSTELPPRFDPADVVESVVSPAGAFRVHFTRAGRHAVPLTDDDADGTPDHVALVARTYDEVLARYRAMGFRAPVADDAVPDDNGGDDRFDVYLLDFGGGSDGAFRREVCSSSGCAGYMIQENDFAGARYPSVEYGVRLLASHELFHAVQAAYDGALGAQGSVLSEGTAVWASERFDPTLADVETLAYGYTSRTDRALGVDPVTAGGAYAYGAGIVFEYLGARYGADLVRELWEDLDASDSDEWLSVLDARLASAHGASFEEAFVGLAEWLFFLGPRPDPTRGPPNGAAFEPVAAMLVAQPYADPSVRMFPASIRHYAVERGRAAVVLGGAGSEGIHVVAVAFRGVSFAERASGLGSVTIDEPSADLTLVALVDGRASGSSRVVSLCIAEEASSCATEPDAGAGVGSDASPGADDAGTSVADAGGTPMPRASCGCRALGASRAPTAALVLVALALCRPRRRRRP